MSGSRHVDPTTMRTWLVVLVGAMLATFSVAVVHLTHHPLGENIKGLVGYHPFSYTMWGMGVFLLVAVGCAGQYRPTCRGIALSLLLVALLAAFPEGACLVGLIAFSSTLVGAVVPLRLSSGEQFRQTMISALTTIVVIIAYLEVWYPTTLPVPVLK